MEIAAIKYRIVGTISVRKVHMPELLRLKGSLFVSKPQPCLADAELFFARSIELSRYQGARAWELRPTQRGNRLHGTWRGLAARIGA